MKPLLTPDDARRLFSYAPDTGVLTWRNHPHTPLKNGRVVGTAHTQGYRRVTVMGRSYLVHRVIWLLVHGRWPTQMIDHIDGDPANNRASNLRDVPRGINAQNRRKAGLTRTLPLGVKRYYRRFVARISVDGKVRHIGTYGTADEAHAAYVAAKRLLHDGCTL